MLLTFQSNNPLAQIVLFNLEKCLFGNAVNELGFLGFLQQSAYKLVSQTALVVSGSLSSEQTGVTLHVLFQTIQCPAYEIELLSAIRFVYCLFIYT